MAETIEENIESVEEEFEEEEVEVTDNRTGLLINKAVFYLNLIAGVTAIIFGLDGLLPVWLAVLCAVPTFTIAGIMYYKARTKTYVAGVEAKV